MVLKRSLVIAVLLWGALLLAPREGSTQTKTEARPPVITNAFAAEKGYYGTIWKIYLEAKDPDGEMLKIAAVVDQVGYGHYPTDYIFLKQQYQKHLKGYVQWNTFSSATSRLKEWTQITLKISIIDKAGNESNEVVFPFTFETGVKGQDQIKPPAPFDQGDLPLLGHININLVEPTSRSGEREKEPFRR